MTPAPGRPAVGGHHAKTLLLRPHARSAKKGDASGTTIDCDAVYRDVIHPAIDAAELEPIRTDEEQVCERSSPNVARVRHARTR
jgi:hypothetical protein